MTLAARLTRHLDRFSATAPRPAAETRPRDGAARTSIVHHWPLLFILGGAAAMLGWIGAIVWAAIWLLGWLLAWILA